MNKARRKVGRGVNGCEVRGVNDMLFTLFKLTYDIVFVAEFSPGDCLSKSEGRLFFAEICCRSRARS